MTAAGAVTPSTGRFEVWDGVPDWWREIAAGAPMMGSWGWLRAASGRVAGKAYTFAVPGTTGTPLAALYGTLQPEPLPTENYDLHHMICTPSKKLPLTAVARAERERIAASAPAPDRWTPSMVVMYPGYECFPVGPGATDPAALDDLVGGIVAWSRAAGARAVAFLYLPPEAAPLGAALARHGFGSLPLNYTFALTVPGPDYDSYLAALPSRRRIEVRREMRLIADAGIELRQQPVEDVFEDLVRLRCALVTKYKGGVDAGRERAKIRRIVDEAAAGAPHVMCAMAGDTVLSVTLFAGADRDWTALAAGTDYADPRSRLCYFATTYYEPVRVGAPLGVRIIRYGQGSWQLKMARGCQPTLMTGWVLALDPALAGTVARSTASTAITL